MTIFRFSAAIALLASLPGCKADAEKPTATGTASQDRYQPIIKRDGTNIQSGELLRSYRENPNRFALENEGKSFSVIARIQRIPEFNEPIADAAGYYLPLLVSDAKTLEERMSEDIRARHQGVSEVDSLSVFIDGFSREKAANLSPKDEIRVRCQSVRVVDNGLVFDKCKVEDK